MGFLNDVTQDQIDAASAATESMTPQQIRAAYEAEQQRLTEAGDAALQAAVDEASAPVSLEEAEEAYRGMSPEEMEEDIIRRNAKLTEVTDELKANAVAEVVEEEESQRVQAEFVARHKEDFCQSLVNGTALSDRVAEICEAEGLEPRFTTELLERAFADLNEVADLSQPQADDIVWKDGKQIRIKTVSK